MHTGAQWTPVSISITNHPNLFHIVSSSITANPSFSLVSRFTYKPIKAFFFAFPTPSFVKCLFCPVHPHSTKRQLSLSSFLCPQYKSYTSLAVSVSLHLWTSSFNFHPVTLGSARFPETLYRLRLMLPTVATVSPGQHISGKTSFVCYSFLRAVKRRREG